MASFNVGFAAQARRANASLGSLKPKSTADIAKSIMLSKPASPSLTKDVEYPENFTWRPPRLSIRESKGRGCGLFTFDFIPAYSRILEEHAMICVSSKQDQDADEIWSKYQLLSREARQDFDEVNASAYQIGKEKANIPYLVSRGYSKTTAMPGEWRSGLFATVSRINHSCTPNSHNHFRENSGAKYVHAARDIQPGEEIEISYFGITLPLAERQWRTQAWSFGCRCPACSGELKANYEMKLSTVHKWSESDPQFQYRYHPGTQGLPKTIAYAMSTATLDEFSWLRTVMIGLYGNYFGALKNNRRSEKEVQDRLETLVLWKERLEGSDHPEVALMKAWAAETRERLSARPDGLQRAIDALLGVESAQEIKTYRNAGGVPVVLIKM